MAKDNTERKRKRRKKKNYLLRLFVLIVFAVGAYFLLTSSIFNVQEIHVENNSYYTSEQIIDKAEAKKGVNILFETNTGLMTEKLLSDPYVKTVKFKRSFPSTLTIVVEERHEDAVIPYSTSFIIIDCDGMVLRKTDVAPEIPALLGLTITKMEPGKPLEVEENAVLKDTLDMLDATKDSDISFIKIDISHVIIKAYIYDQLLCQGMPEDVLESILNGNLSAVLYDLYSNGIEKGVINIGSDNYCAFNPMIE